MPDLFDILHREWPVIKNAKYSFFISIVAVFAIVWFVFDRVYKRRFETMKAQLESSSRSTSPDQALTSTPEPEREPELKANIICTEQNLLA